VQYGAQGSGGTADAMLATTANCTTKSRPNTIFRTIVILSLGLIVPSSLAGYNGLEIMASDNS
jgi:hypothetical protein